MNKVIGLTGGIGSGKSTAAHFWAENVPSIDADDIILSFFQDKKNSVYEAMVDTFGSDILKGNHIDRDLLRNKLHNQPNLRKISDTLVIPAVWEKVLNFQTQNLDSPYILFVSARLIEAQFPVFKKIVIDCSEEVRIQRAVARGTQEDVVRKIIYNQIPNSEKIKEADYILVNQNTLEDLKQNVSVIHENLIKDFNYLKKQKL